VNLSLPITFNFVRLLIHEFSGVTTEDQRSGSSGSVYPINPGSVTTTSAKEVLFGWGVADNNNTQAGTGYTLARTQASMSTEYQVVGSVGTYDATFPGDGANSAWAAIMTTYS
jgi:hypothetical protein